MPKINIRKNISKKKLIVMPLMNNYLSRKEWEKACWQKMLNSQKLLSLLVSAHERHDLIMRAVCAEHLLVGESYKKIGEELWLSPQTISGIKKAINGKEYKSYLEWSKKERKKKVYGSTFSALKQKRSQYREGRPHRTKYGTVYI